MQTDNFVGGTYGPDDGHFDAYAALMGYKAKARSLGAEYLKNDVEKITTRNGRVAGVQAGFGRVPRARYIINCAGAWAAQIAATAGVNLPVVPVKRQVFTLDTAVKPQGPLPLTVLPSGLYFRTETGGIILLGKSMAQDPTGFQFSWDDKRFMEILWPELAEFVPAFDRLKLVRGWAGLYAVNTLDGNAILGEWPEVQASFWPTASPDTVCNRRRRWVVTLLNSFWNSPCLWIFQYSGRTASWKTSPSVKTGWFRNGTRHRGPGVQC